MATTSRESELTDLAGAPVESGLLASLLEGDAYLPPESQSLEETGVNPILIEGQVLKYVSQVGSCSGHEIAHQLCLPFRILEDLLLSLRRRQLLVHQGQSQLCDYVYALTELGAERARAAITACAYIGPVPVPLEDYLVSVEAQTIRAEAARRPQVIEAFSDIHVEPEMFEQLGPAINSGAGLFLYGAPGNGKTTIAKRITRCFGQSIWISHTICEDGQYIKLFDGSFHEPVDQGPASLLRTASHDHRWIKILRSRRGRLPRRNALPSEGASPPPLSATGPDQPGQERLHLQRPPA